MSGSRVLIWIPGGVMALLTFCAGVGPNEAAAHLAEWWALIPGVDAAPAWLATKTADKWGVRIGILGLLIWASFITWKLFFQQSKAVQAHPSQIIVDKNRDVREQAKSILKLRAQKQPLLKIEFKYEEVPHEGFFNWFTNSQGKNIQRYRIRIHNLSAVPIRDVEVKLETIERLEDEMCGIKPISLKQVGYSLTFEKSGSRVMTIHGHDSEWVPVLSYESQIFGHVSVEGIDRKGSGIDTEGKIMSPHHPHRIKIVARGHEVKEDTAFFFVRLEAIGGSQRLIMKQIEPESFWPSSPGLLL